MKNWITTLTGFVGNGAVATSIGAVASPDVASALQSSGMSPITVLVIGFLAKMCQAYFTKDRNVTGGTVAQ